MNKQVSVSTPSRLCLFGEHLDYLGLEVIAVAINLRFSAKVTKRDDKLIKIKIRDSKIDSLGMDNELGLYNEYEIALSKPIEYESKRDYLKSCVNVLLKYGCELSGYDIQMDSTIPIGKGMCSSSTMVVVLIKALLEACGHPDKDNPEKVAYLGYSAEVLEFGEPGGMMDHYTSALGGLVNLSFKGGETKAFPLDCNLSGKFILFDSLVQKDTIGVLARAKTPALKALDALSKYGITDIRDFVNEENLKYLDELEPDLRRVLEADIDDFKILLEAKAMFASGKVDNAKLGELIYRHHKNLRDGLSISTPAVESIIDTAMVAGAWGGKINGTGGGGCCYVYADAEKCDEIIEAVKALGYPGQVISQDSGVRNE